MTQERVPFSGMQFPGDSCLIQGALGQLRPCSGFHGSIPVETSVANMVQSDRQVGRTFLLEQGDYRKGMLRADW